MRQPNFSQLYFRYIRHTSILSRLVAGEREKHASTTIGVANLHVFHIRGRPFSSDLDSACYVVKHMAFNARGIAHGSEERAPLIFVSHANRVFLFRLS